MSKISHSVSKLQKKGMTVQSVQSVQLTWKSQEVTCGNSRRKHMAAPGGDTWQVDLVYEKIVGPIQR
jgi:hypothetical protein